MTDTENLPAIPENWCWTKIEEFSEVILGQSPPSSTYNENGFGLPFYQGKAEFGELYPTTKKWCTSPKKLAEKGDVLISVRAPVGPTNICPEKSCIGRGLAAIRGLHNIDSFFVLFALRAYESQIAGKGTGTTFNAITGDQLKSFEIPLPPLLEQHRIVQKIEELFTDLDAGVQELEKAKVQVKNYRRAVLKAAVEGKITEEWRKQNPDIESSISLLNQIGEGKGKLQTDQKRRIKKFQPLDNEDLSLLPESWSWTRLDCIADIKGGITKDSKRKIENGKEIPYLRVANVQRGYLDLNEVKYIEASETVISELLLKYGDILFTEGGDRDKLGRGWIWQDNLPECIHQNHIFRARLYSEEISSKFISWFANIHAQYFMDVGKQTTNLASINLTKLSEFPVAIPPAEEQKVIVSEIERRFSVIDQIEKTIDQSLVQAEKLRQSILKKAFEGKLVPQDPNDEPASVLLERIKQEKGRVKSRKKPGKGRKVKSETIMEVSGKMKQAELF